MSTPNGLSGSCGGGTITATAGSGSVSLAGGTLAPSGACSFSANGTAIAAGAQNNVTDAVNSVEGGSGSAASASVTVAAAGSGPASVPMLSPWAFGLFGLLLAAGAIAVLRTRR